MLLEYHADRVVITVVDAGDGFTFRNVPEVGSSRTDGESGERLGSFGLPLLEMMADQLDFCRTDTQGTTVRAEKFLRYETQEALEHVDDMDNADSGGKAAVSGG